MMQDVSESHSKKTVEEHVSVAQQRYARFKKRDTSVELHAPDIPLLAQVDLAPTEVLLLRITSCT